MAALSDFSAQDVANWGREVLQAEALALSATAARIGPSFAEAVQTVLGRQGKVVVSGLGKSGHVARKIASTLSSTGTAACFLHPSEALHGDFGLLQSCDTLVAVAYGGETSEVLEVARFARRIGAPVIAITGGMTSTLAQLAHIVFDASVEREADPLNLAPTSSSTVAMALGDAFAASLMRARGFSPQDFASLHPGGRLGRRLSLVRDHMHPTDRLPRLLPTADFHSVLEAVTVENIGIAAVTDTQGRLIGAISDGDLRRALLKHGAQALASNAGDLMSRQPRTIAATTLAIDAVSMMNGLGISRVFVVSCTGDVLPLGLVRLQDLLAAKIL